MNAIDETVARRCLEVVDAGLVSGLGQPKLGKMCVEAAINFALGEPHGDQPKCVSPSLRKLKIKLNDANWSSNEARTKGLRRLALAQLGSAGVLDEVEFAKRVATLAIRVFVPEALRAAAKLAKGTHKFNLLKAADACEADPTRANAVSAKETADAAAAYAAAAAAYADADADADADAYADAAAAAYADARNAARDKSLAAFCESVVQILIEMKAPGCQWLWLTEAA